MKQAPTPDSDDSKSGLPRRRDDLVHRAKAGDEQALNDLFEAHYQQLRRYVRIRLGPKLRREFESQDVLHSAFRGALRNLPDFEPQGDEAWVRWLASIIHHTISDKARQQDAQKRGGGDRGVGGTQGAGLLSQSPVGSPSPPALAEAREEEDLLYAALEQLPDGKRQILVMAHIQKLSHAEIGEQVGCKADAVRHRIARAEVALRAVLERMSKDS